MILMQSQVGRAPLFDTWANWAPELDKDPMARVVEPGTEILASRLPSQCCSLCLSGVQ